MNIFKNFFPSQKIIVVELDRSDARRFITQCKICVVEFADGNYDTCAEELTKLAGMFDELKLR